MENQHAATSEFDNLNADDISIGPSNDAGESNTSQEATTSTQDTDEPGNTSSEPGAGEEDAAAEAQGSDKAEGQAEGDEASSEKEQDGSEAEEAASDEGDFYEPEEVNDLITQITGHGSVEELVAELDDLRQKANNNQEAPSLEGFSPFTQKLIEFEQNGGDPQLFAYTQSVDFDGMDSKEILKTQFMFENPDFDKSKAERVFEAEYRNLYGDSEDLTDEEREDREAKLELAAHKARNDLKKAQEVATHLPEPKEQEEEAQQVSPELRAFAEKHNQTVSELMDGIKSLNLNLGDDEKDALVMPVDEDAAAQIRSWLETPAVNTDHPQFSDTVVSHIFTDPDNPTEIDYQSAVRKLMFIQDPDGYEKRIFEHAFKKGQEAHVTKKVNPHNERTAQEYGERSLTELEEVGEAFANARSNG